MKESNDTAEHLVNHRISRIERLSRIDLDILEEVQRLVPQLSGLQTSRDVPQAPAVEERIEGLIPVAVDLATPAADFQPVFEPLPATPPAHPTPVDRGRFRIAEEPPGTDLRQSWVLDRCVECREAVFTHNAAAAAKHETVCETCYYMLLSDYWDRQHQQFRQMTLRAINPFE